MSALLALAVWLAPWELYAVEFARSDDVKVRRLVRGAAADERVDMSWYFFVAIGRGRVVLIDTGTDAFTRSAKLRRAWKVDYAITVKAALGRLGLTPQDVTDVLLTHRHWDHAGGVATFGEASERVLGIRVRKRGRHTADFKMIALRCSDRMVTIAGDAAYLYRNIEQRRPVTVTTDRKRNVADVQAAVAEVGIDNVLPGHDPAVFERYPDPRRGVAAICPRP